MIAPLNDDRRSHGPTQRLPWEGICTAVRCGYLAEAEALLTSSHPGQRSEEAMRLNLLGVVREKQASWDEAAKYYRKAAAADRGCVAARANIRRLYELYTFGRCGQRACL